ncbi:MAG: Gnt-II system L-idonate transporter [Verrucomicrobiota bacterium]|jgi:GntP family gluconate:H+ symporter
MPPTAAAPTYWPLLTLAIAILFVIVAITRLRLHAFVALILAAFLVGFLTPEFKPELLNGIGAAVREDARANSWVAAVELTSLEFGKAAGGIAISIGLASIIGLCLMESGAADKVVRRFLAVFGVQRAGIALLASTYILSIPIFFDTMFMLMVPLAKALRLRTGRSYLLYLMCICAGGVVTHSLTVPHPGPLAMVDSLRVDAGLSLLVGIAAGILPCVAGYVVASWLDRRTEVPLRETPGQSLQELQGISGRPESQLPSFFWSIIPVLLPIGLISLASFFKLAKGSGVESALGTEAFAQLARLAFFIGNKNIALAIGTAIAVGVFLRQRGIGLGGVDKFIGPPLETAGVIILITAAGGAFGGMLRNAGVGDAIGALAKTYSINLILLSWLTAAVIRVAQGSATVALLTTAAIVWPMIDPAAPGNTPLPFHRMYLFLSIGFGSFCCSWMNDSGFWVVSRLSGMTERETLRSWTVMLTVLSVFGLLFTWTLATLLPLAPAPVTP